MMKKRSELLFRQAKQLYREENYAEALEILNSICSQYPNVRNLLQPRALCLYHLGRRAEARTACEHLVERFDDHTAREMIAKMDAAATQHKQTPAPASSSSPALATNASSNAQSTEPETALPLDEEQDTQPTSFDTPVSTPDTSAKGALLAPHEHLFDSPEMGTPLEEDHEDGHAGVSACLNHAGMAAVARCTGCAEPFCANCLVEIHGKRYCADCKTLAMNQAESAIGLPALGAGTSQTNEAMRPLIFSSKQGSPNAGANSPPLQVRRGGTPCKEANDALLLALVSLFCFGVILGPIAINKGFNAQKRIKADEHLDGMGKSVAAIVIGIVSTIFSALIFLSIIVSNT